MKKKGTKKTTESQDVSRKSATVRQDATIIPATTSDAAKRDAARRWAASDKSDTELVTQSTGSKSSSRQKGSKKVSDKVPEAIVEDAQSLELQNFIASQNPPIDEGVSSTVRLGRALVSGALGRRNDDPKLFGTEINIVECKTTSDKEKGQSTGVGGATQLYRL